MSTYISYTTDILRRKDNYIIEFSQIDKNDILGIIQHARKLKCPIIAQTGPSKRYPNGGKWYLKGKDLNYYDLKNDIENAYENNEYPTIKLFLIKLNQ